MSVQKKIQSTLEQTGIPFKEINVYGSQIVITSWSLDAANKWALLLGRFATVRRVMKSVDYAKENKNTVLRPSTIEVWRTYATV